jgi:hypothetical protein
MASSVSEVSVYAANLHHRHTTGHSRMKLCKYRFDYPWYVSMPS